VVFSPLSRGGFPYKILCLLYFCIHSFVSALLQAPHPAGLMSVLKQNEKIERHNSLPLVSFRDLKLNKYYCDF